MDTFNPNQMPPMPSQPEKKQMGPLIAVIVILAIIIIGGLYFLKTRSAQKAYPTNTPTETSPTANVQQPTDSVVASMKQQGTSDSLSSIEADLKATDLNNLDQGAAALEASLQ